jgi:hypothetical protein
MGFHLGHGNDEVMAEHGAREKKMAQASVVCAELDLNQLIAIEVNKRDSALSEFVSVPAFMKHQLCIALVPGAFGDGDRESTKPPEALRGGSD